jgi:hypothetical protein
MCLYLFVYLINVDLILCIDHFGTLRFVIMADILISLELSIIMHLPLNYALHVKLIVLKSTQNPEGLGFVIVIEAAHTLRVEIGPTIILIVSDSPDN